MTFERIKTAPEQWVAYFGYGSLVNDRTRNADSFGIPGRLKGYARHWSIWEASPERRAFGLQGAAALSVSPESNAYCDGLLVFDLKEHLPQVDLREAKYERVKLDLADFATDHENPVAIESYIYVGKPALTDEANPKFPILQSYIDAVMQGFLEKFGVEGLQRFVAETDGWHTPILQDRQRPLYPRSVELTLEEEALVDRYVNQSHAPMVSMESIVR
ncbi:gamma-glutamylcyclotransferase family protein [uncultured Cohaesibacter sp.]|uniref:gamma-glutamylcyclotransferase family protein n=1 Tax=uncultured Cohaesibacter sp. TaxID=1002546 RepID=UPI00292E7EA3|nr:gamma-glutamylcyclotransferase family protein [uncultured Cohaesibacter sp.]